MATYYIDDTQGSASGSGSGGGGNSYLRNLSQLVESQGRQRYYDYLMNQPQRDEAKYNRVKADAREQMRYNWMGRAWDEYRDENINEKKYNFNSSNLRLTQIQKVRLMKQLDDMLKAASEGEFSIADVDFDKGELPATYLKEVDDPAVAQSMVSDIKALSDREKVHLENLVKIPQVVLNDEGVPISYERNNFARNAYISEFGIDPITRQPVTDTSEQRTPPSLSPRESLDQAPTESSPSGFKGFWDNILDRVQQWAPADTASPQFIQDEVGPSGMPAEAFDSQPTSDLQVPPQFTQDEVGPSGMPTEAFDAPTALQSEPVEITDPRYVTPIPAPLPQSDMGLMEMDGSMGPAYIPTSNTGLMDMDGNLMPEFTAPPVRSSGLMMNQDGTMGESIQPFLPYLNKNLPQEEIPFDPQGTGYNYPEALRAGNMWSSPDDKWFSRVPSTGQLLKGTGHKSWPQTVAGETEAGNVITEGPDGMMYSNPPTIGPEAFRDATPDQKARDNRKIMLESEMEGLRDLGDLWEDRVNVLENKELVTSIIQYVDLLTGVVGAGRALLTKFGFAGLKKLLSSKSGAELADEAAQIQANKSARALARQRAAAQQTYTGAGAAKGGPAVRGVHGRFSPAPQMEYKIIPDLPKPPVPTP